MRVARDLDALRAGTAALRAGGRTLAFVPTMGALHAGHSALVAEARRLAAATVASIFANRNRFLSLAERALAPRLHREMRRAAEDIGAGAPMAAALDGAARELGCAGFGVDYFALVEAETMRPLGATPPAPGGGSARLVAAARLGAVRLLDNLPVPPPGGVA